MRLRPLFVASLSVLLPLSASAAPDSYRTRFGTTVDSTRHVLVRYKEGRAAIARQSMRKSRGVMRTKQIRRIDIDVVAVPEGQTLQSFVDQLNRDPDIEFAEPNGVMRAFMVPNDPSYSTQYSLKSNTTNVEAAWDITVGVSSITVAVIDTGITPTHTDLSNNLWSNPAPSGTSGSYGTQMEIDWNGDGDCSDIDVRDGPEQCESATPIDDNGPEYHGTRVAGIIAATTNNGIGMAGVAHGCRIMTVKALNADGVGSFEAIARGIIYAVDNGASVINMSLGGPSTSQSVVAAVNYAIANNVVVVAAAGNSGNQSSVNFPAAIEKVIAVGATDSTNTLASFSCTGTSLDLVAPGVGVRATIAPNTTDDSSPASDGTSFASPIVAGVAALIRSIDGAMPVDEVTRYIDFSATDLGIAGFDNGYGFGLLNALNAVQSARDRTQYVSNPAQANETFPSPNPFLPLTHNTTMISLPSSLGSENIEIKIFNIAGELVRTLSDEVEWDGRNDEGSLVASGLYIYFAKTSKGDVKGKVSVIK